MTLPLFSMFLRTECKQAATLQANAHDVHFMGMFHIAVQKNSSAEFKRALKQWGLYVPPTGACFHETTGSVLSVAPDTYMLVSNTPQLSNFEVVQKRLAGVAWVFDLTGSRTVLKLSMTDAERTLARLTPIDFSVNTDQKNFVIDTNCEGIPMMIWRDLAKNSCYLAAPSSYAQALSHVVGEFHQR
jgi:heterotetrameric sarcosine oxidase gamma subunit